MREMQFPSNHRACGSDVLIFWELRCAAGATLLAAEGLYLTSPAQRGNALRPPRLEFPDHGRHFLAHEVPPPYAAKADRCWVRVTRDRVMPRRGLQDSPYLSLGTCSPLEQAVHRPRPRTAEYQCCEAAHIQKICLVSGLAEVSPGGGN